MEDGRGSFGYPSNNGRENNEDLDTFLRLFACGGPLPPTNYPFASFLSFQFQPQMQLVPLPADAVESPLLAPDLPLLTDPATVVAGRTGQGTAMAALLQSAGLLQDPHPYQSWFANTPMWFPEADPARLQPLTPIIEAPVPSVQPPANDPALPENTTEPGSSRRGGARPSRSNRRRKRDRERTVRRMIDATLSPDPWAWRKYGQKVIKGSGNMRSYYKCTTDKSCKARKYVERCSTNPMHQKVTFIETHCHPVPVPPQSAASVDVPAALASTPAPAAPPPPAIPAVEGPPQAPAPPLPAFAPARLSPFLSFTGVGLDVEDYRATIASEMHLNENHMTLTPEDTMLPQEGLQFPTPEAGASSSSGGGNDGSNRTAPAPAAIDEMLCDEPWRSLSGWQ